MEVLERISGLLSCTPKPPTYQSGFKDMNPLVLAAQFLGISTFVTLIWLVVRAFRKHAGWGFAVLLFSPIGAALFGARYWDDEKKPFLAYGTSLVATLTLGIYLFTTQGGMELVHTV